MGSTRPICRKARPVSPRDDKSGAGRKSAMTADSEFGGKAAFITGAARGFGKAFAETLSTRGAAVAIVDVDLDEGERVARAIGASGGSAMAIGCDVNDDEAVAAAVARVAAAYGGIDILINNA